ncbi:DNA gyrase subunit A [Candidatus Portiera aleyrodidarum]|uniref:DNA gyrase subunit A n=1 Tax=Candidatus Portiera aleyrodidarum TV TaxID=1297582 RepID=A0A8D4BPW2_9GAMM|nr:DNA gyrase subunit A [Candidatus Portiera aleyrodidarum]AGI27225.1 DNA gyrase subunit A [Candidatus Portiera aleyrodidarum TV]CEI59214.1 DNA gyrase subunit A [Candidatus Portiera aleyrodidarum]
MFEKNKEILPITIEDEIKQSYLDYAMSVIIGRAIPDIRDGLKPVHRRVIFAMHELNNVWKKTYLKSARVVGDVIGKYHPHGDSAVYDAIVRMAQFFSMRYVLIDGQGNFGSIDGDNAAAMRYTEVRLSRITSEFLYDLEKSTVDWVDNYDGTEKLPEVLPSRIPNLLINGTSGIAVGMATNIPPHNIKEVINACLAFIDNKNISIEYLMKYIKGPDFPTSGIIHGSSGILEAYKTGKGSIYIRAKHIIVKNNIKGNEFIIITELPYQVNKARLIEKIVDLVKHKRLSGINELRDESDKDGLRIVIEIKRYESSEIILNNLFAHTQMEVIYSINMVAVDKGKPKTFNLKQIIEAFINQRIEVIKRRTLYELKKFNKRKHIIEGLIIAISNIDIVIEIIKSASSFHEAKYKLSIIKWNNTHFCKDFFLLSESQIKAIMDLRLHRLTCLEIHNSIDEYNNTLNTISQLKKILSSFEYLMEIIRNELIEIRSKYGDNRKTTINAIRNELHTVDLINEEKMVVTVSRSGYAKIQPISVYQAQKRGGRGKLVTSINDEDVIEHLLVASTHDTILLFSDKGKVYWLKVYEIPQNSRISRGRPLVNLLSLDVKEKITAILAINDENRKKNNYIFFATALGKVKRTHMKQFARQRNCGILALNLEDGDSLIGAAITYGKDNLIMLLASNGKSIYFKESEVRAMGRNAMGVMGMRLFYNNKVISLIIIKNKKQSQKYYILTASEKGYGKRTILEEFNLRKRGGQGVIAMRSSKRNGKIVSAIKVKESDEIILITNRGNLIRTRVQEISCRSRNTQGVTLIRVNKKEKLVSVVRLGETIDLK